MFIIKQNKGEIKMNNIIMQKTTIRIGDGINSTIKKEVNVPIIPTCKTCSKRRSKCAKNNIYPINNIIFIFISPLTVIMTT